MGDWPGLNAFNRRFPGRRRGSFNPPSDLLIYYRKMAATAFPDHRDLAGIHRCIRHDRLRADRGLGFHGCPVHDGHHHGYRRLPGNPPIGRSRPDIQYDSHFLRPRHHHLCCRQCRAVYGGGPHSSHHGEAPLGQKNRSVEEPLPHLRLRPNRTDSVPDPAAKAGRSGGH